MRSARLRSVSGPPCSGGGRRVPAGATARAAARSGAAGAGNGAAPRPASRRCGIRGHDGHRALGPVVGQQVQAAARARGPDARRGGRSGAAVARMPAPPRGRATGRPRGRHGSPPRPAAVSAHTPGPARAVRCRRSRSSRPICLALARGLGPGRCAPRCRAATGGDVVSWRRCSAMREAASHCCASQPASGMHQALGREDQHRGVVGAVQQFETEFETGRRREPGARVGSLAVGLCQSVRAAPPPPRRCRPARGSARTSANVRQPMPCSSSAMRSGSCQAASASATGSASRRWRVC